MTLADQSVVTGNLLFRWRGFIPLCFIAILVPAFQGFRYPHDSRAAYMVLWGICVGISLIGVVLRAYTVGYAAKGTSGRNTKEGQIAETLNTTGIYSIVRNPLYLGNFMIMLGQIMLLRSVWCILVYVLSFWLYYERIIMAEESFLKQKFGAAYEAYTRFTPAFVPKLSLWKKTVLSYSLKFMIRKECHGLFVMMIIFSVLGMTCDAVATGSFMLANVWAWISGISTLVYVLINLVTKKMLNDV
jgi:protein-S-isoprenylcysteine O-methyltransferase Ste14